MAWWKKRCFFIFINYLILFRSSKIGRRDKNRRRSCYKRPGGSQRGHIALLMRRFGSCNITFSFRPLRAFGPSRPKRKRNAARPKPSHHYILGYPGWTSTHAAPAACVEKPHHWHHLIKASGYICAYFSKFYSTSDKTTTMFYAHLPAPT
jgi:hypothetical protein